MMKILVFVGSLILFVHQASAASIDWLHPSNGSDVKSSFQYVGKIVDLPLNRPVDVILSIRDKETGDEVSISQFLIDAPKRNNMIIERVDLPSFQNGRPVTVTLTARDEETGDELTSGTIEAFVKDK